MTESKLAIYNTAEIDYTKSVSRAIIAYTLHNLCHESELLYLNLSRIYF